MPQTALPRGSLALIGAGVEVGASCLGAGMGPAALRVAGLPAALQTLGYTVIDRGDLAPGPVEGLPAPVAGLAKYPAEIVAWARAIDEAVSDALATGAVPLVMGGDHSLAMGSVRAASRHAAAAGRPLFVLWLDAHPDFNTPATSPSGNMHGMSVAALCGEFGLETLGDLPPAPRVEPRNLLMFGIRSIDAEERKLLRDRKIGVVGHAPDRLSTVSSRCCVRSSRASRTPAECCTSASMRISSILPSPPASARRSPAVPPTARPT